MTDGSPDRPPSAALMLRIAGRQGPTFALRINADTTLGRAADAGIVVADRLASRAHAAVRFDASTRRWVLRDLGSRNGTWLDGKQITSAPLSDGATVRIGTSELVFRQFAATTTEPPVDAGRFVRCGPVAQLEGSVLRRASAGSTDDARRPMLLYQASIRLLTSRSVREVIGTTLELAAQHCGTKGVGWFKVHAAERLEPLCVVPPGSPLTRLLGDSTRRLVAVEGNAVWIADATTGPDAEEHEIACVPIVEGGRVHAALAAMAAKGALRTADFDFLVALASLAAAACAGHAEPSSPPMRDEPPAATGDLASLQTVDLDVSDDHDNGLDSGAGTITLDEAAVAQLGIARNDGPAGDSPQERTRIESFVAEIPMLKLDQWQRMLVVEALRRAGGSVPGAAAELGISRTLLHRQLERYGLIR
ncbi:MAG: FHA domain-containing protein [Planctomycetia bacterium]